MSETKLTDEAEDEPESAGPYTCIRCTAGTWSDDDLCDACAEEGRLEAAGRAALSDKGRG